MEAVVLESRKIGKVRKILIVKSDSNLVIRVDTS